LTLYQDRKANFLDLPLPKGYVLLHPEQTVLVYQPGTSVDIGNLCFASIEEKVRRRGKAYRVVTSSFIPSRISLVSKIISYLSSRFEREEFRPLTDATHARRVVEFIRWCLNNGREDVLSTREQTERALLSYADHLRERIRSGSLSPNTAGPMQSDSHAFCKEVHQDQNLARRLRPIDRGLRFSIPTETPDEKSVSRVLALANALFNDLSALALDFSPFPHPIRVPEYLNLPKNTLWYFPGRKPFLTAEDRRLAATGKPRKKFRPIDFENGRIFETEAIIHQYPPRKAKLDGTQSLDWRTASRSVNEAHRKIKLANSNRHDEFRIEAGMKAHNAFLILFAADTGMNAAVLNDCPYSEDLAITEGRPNFRTIKFRASKEISFEISTSLLPQFKRFLQLRSYLLDGIGFDKLFFTFGYNLGITRQPRKMGLKLLYPAYDVLERIDPSLSFVMPRQWRINSADFYIRASDTHTAAAIIQNSERTLQKNYAQGSSATAALELTNFFKEVRSQISQEASDVPSNGKLAGCREPGFPQAADPHTTTEPDCRKLGGCLFCDKFVVHADETDLRKLMSCKYLINTCKHLSQSGDSYQAHFGEVISRIDAILHEIKNISDNIFNLAKRIEFEVNEDQILDPHYQYKLDQLINLGVSSANPTNR
jgi:hypothetical protein